MNAAARALEALPLTSASSTGGTSESTKSWSWPECDSACYGSRKVGNSPDGPSDTAPWHDKSLNPPSVLLLDDDGGVVSALDILSKQIAHGGNA